MPKSTTALKTSTNASITTPFIEKRAMERIPDAQWHGHTYSQFTLWPGANLPMTAIIPGALAVVSGGNG